MTQLLEQLDKICPTALTGKVVWTEGTTIGAAGFPAPVGAVVEIEPQGGVPIQGEVIGFRDSETLIYPLGDVSGVSRGSRVRIVKTYRSLRIGDQLLGRVVDAHGIPIDGALPLALVDRTKLTRRPPSAIDRPRTDTAISTGIRSIDAMLTCARGQRMGVFSGAGVGKSVLLGMMARFTNADVNVIGLIGERGREVNEFIQRELGKDGLNRSVVVVSTSDEPALLRVQAAQTATAIAEYFRDREKHVMLMMDSLSRFATAQREVSLAAGEPPAGRGYPPSVFSALARLVERAGTSRDGSITAFYSVLVEGDDLNEPVSDAVRGLLDGHVVLSRKLASSGHYPAVDVLESISRLMTEIVSSQHRAACQRLRELLAVYRDNEDLISIGAYCRGSNSRLDDAIEMQDKINQFLCQQVDQPFTLESAREQLIRLVST